jgi:DNA-binding XRE family transcriptional regulator
MQFTTAKCKVEPMATSKTRQAIQEMLHTIRHNDLKARRLTLGLSRAALGRILDVDPATVFRQERGVMSPLWDYAMRGIEAEAKKARSVLRDHQKEIDRRDLIPDTMGERGYKYTAEKMKSTKPKPRTVKAPLSPHQAEPPWSRMPSRAVIMAAVDRAEARSKLQKESRPLDHVGDAPASANRWPATISGRQEM